MEQTTRIVQGSAPPRGRYPHLRRVGDWLFVSGVSSRRPDGSFAGASADAMGNADLDIAVQTRAVLENIGTILASEGASLRNVVDMSCFLVSMNDFKGFNAVYNTFFDETGPTRTTVAVHALPHPHILVEIKAVAFGGSPGTTPWPTR